MFLSLKSFYSWIFSATSTTAFSHCCYVAKANYNITLSNYNNNTPECPVADIKHDYKLDNHIATGNKGPQDTYPVLLQGQLLLNHRTNQLQ